MSATLPPVQGDVLERKRRCGEWGFGWKLAPPLLNVHRSWPTERMEIQARPAYMSSLGLGGTEGRQHAQANPALVALFLRN